MNKYFHKVINQPEDLIEHKRMFQFLLKNKLYVSGYTLKYIYKYNIYQINLCLLLNYFLINSGYIKFSKINDSLSYIDRFIKNTYQKFSSYHISYSDFSVSVAIEYELIHDVKSLVFSNYVKPEKRNLGISRQHIDNIIYHNMSRDISEFCFFENYKFYPYMNKNEDFKNLIFKTIDSGLTPNIFQNESHVIDFILKSTFFKKSYLNDYKKIFKKFKNVVIE